MTKLTILRGISGSGKSTWARSQAGNPVIVSRDDLRLAFYGSDGPDYYEVAKDVLRAREDFISTVEQAAITNALRAGVNVISDNTHTMMKYVNRVAKVGYAAGATVELKTFDVPLATALDRVAARAALKGRDVPVDAIKRQHDQLQGSKSAVLNAPAPIVPYTGTPGKPKAFLCDIDGTLAHNNGKRGFYDWKQVGKDDPDEVVCNVVDALQSGHEFIAMSGRDEVCRPETEQWLEDNLLSPDALFMRPQGDMRSDNIIKAELFDTYVRDNYDVQFVIDDRWQVCQMWLTMGLKVFNVSGLDRGEF